MSNKIPELLRDAKQRAAAILTEIDDLSGRGNLTPGQEERLERQVSAGERIHGEIEALEVAQTEMLREAFANGWGGGGSDTGPALIPDQRAWQEPITPRSTKNELEYRALHALDSAPDVDRDRIE